MYRYALLLLIRLSQVSSGILKELWERDTGIVCKSVLVGIKLSQTIVEKINAQSPIDAQSLLNARVRGWLKK